MRTRSVGWFLSMRHIAIAAAVVVAALGALFGCSHAETHAATLRLVVWGLQFGEDTKGLEAEVAAFQRMHPGIDVSVLSMGAGGMNPQKLMTAIAGGVPPDVISQDRFTIGDWAIRDCFQPLDDYIARDRDRPLGVRPEDYYTPCWREATYTDPRTGKGHVFAIPSGTDDRALLYNKKLFREAGIVDAHGDPRPPRTWDELYQDTVRLTQSTPDGGYKRIGFIPNYGNAWLYIYSWENDGEFMSPDGRRCTMNAAPNVEALNYMVRLYDALGGVERVDAFQSGFQSGELDPFLTGKVAMKIDGCWVPENVARYGPDLDFGVAPAPVPTARLTRTGRFASDTESYITWAGGFSLAIPRGAPHPDTAWEFIKWMSSPQAALIAAAAQRDFNASKHRPYVPEFSANRVATDQVFAKFGPKEAKFGDAMRVFLDLLPHARFRPVTFVGQRLWDEHVRAFDNATHHATTGMTAREAMDQGTQVVQRELDYVLGRYRFPVIPRPVWFGLALAFVAGVGGGGLVWLIRLRRLRQLARSEAWAGFVFAAPWMVGFVLLTAGPILASIVLSLCDYDVLHPARFVGLYNYRQLLGPDSYYLRTSLWNVTYTALLGIPLGIATSLSVAMLLNAKVKGMSFYRTCYYLPSIVPVVASALLWWWLLNGDPDRGLVDAAWKATLGHWLGWKAPGWFGSADWSKPGLILQGIWGAGAGMILWLAGLQGVPQHLYEAADLDGAGPVAKFRNVTIPMLSPYILFNLVMGTIAALQEFDRVYVMSGGDPSASVGPVDSLLMPVVYLFKNAFQYFKMGYASALAWILFLIVLVLTVAQLKLAPKWVHYEGQKP